MNRRAFLGSLALLAAPLAAEAQQEAAKIPRIGYLSTNLAGTPQQHEAFLQGLRDLGYVKGRNVVIEYRSAEGHDEQLPALASELVALKVDVIVAAAGTLAALAAKQATRTLPFVFIAVGDPVTSGLVTSLARPGGNATGLSAVSPELVGKWLELLKQAAPTVSRVAFLWQPGGLGERQLQALRLDQAHRRHSRETQPIASTLALSQCTRAACPRLRAPFPSICRRSRQKNTGDGGSPVSRPASRYD